MALAASSGLSTSMLVGLRRASAVGELLGEITKHGLSMTVIFLSKGTTCMLLKKKWNYRVTGLSKRKRTNMKLRVGLNNSAEQSDPICHHCFMFMRNPNIQNPKISTACYSAMHPNGYFLKLRKPGPNTTFKLNCR